MNTIEVTILPEDFKNALRFDSTTECPLAMALKRTLPNREFWVLPNMVTDHTGDNWNNNLNYKIPDEWENPTTNRIGYYKGENIDDIIKRAHESMKNIPTVNLILTQIQKQEQ